MNLKKAILGKLLVLFVSFGLQAQMEETKMSWEPNGLTWADFKASPDPNSHFFANTASGISYSWSMRGSAQGKEYQYEVYSFFLPEKSWVRAGGGSANLLAHEQLHFDITELFARKLRKALTEFDFENSRNLKGALQDLYKKMETERALLQRKYDAETSHSVKEDNQVNWQKYIEAELKELEQFAS